MRLVSLLVMVSLVFAPGCAALAVPPLVGATGGIAVAMADSHASHKASRAVAGGLLGGLIGVVLDVVYIGILIHALDNARWGD